MIPIKGYKQITFPEFLEALNTAFSKCNKSHLQVAADIGAKSVQTTRNALIADEFGDQIVSDNVLTKVMASLEMEGLIVYANGQKFYYAK